MDRRYLLSLIGSSSVLVLAGCMSGEEGSDESGDSESGEDDDSDGGSKESDSRNDTEDDGERESEDDDAEGETDGSTNAENDTDDDSGDSGTEEDVNSFPHLSLEDIADPNGGEVNFTVEVLHQFGDEGPAELDITLTNDSSSDRTFEFGGFQPFDRPWGEHTESNATIVVVPGEDTPTPPTEDHIPNEPTNESCWQAIRPVVVEEELVSIDTAPGESIGGTHLVLADHESEECLERGTYQFSATVGMNGDDVTLSFSLLLESRNG